MKKLLFNLILISIILSCNSKNKFKRCSISNNSIKLDYGISFEPSIIPISLNYSFETGFSIQGDAKLNLGFGTIALTATLSTEEEKYLKFYKLIIKQKKFEDKIYYVKNTDNLEIKVTHASGQFKLKMLKGYAILDLTNEEYCELELIVDKFYSPLNSSSFSKGYISGVEKLNFRVAPNKNSEVIYTLTTGTNVVVASNTTYISDKITWVKVCVNNYEGWISLKYLTPIY